jgi:peptidoglycan/xylan/chitin deacetylase (PgdA/CDA1 family)
MIARPRQHLSASCRLVVFGLLLAGSTFALGAQRFLVVRYDDYAPVTLYAGWHPPALERRLFELFERHRARLVVGVTPFPVATNSESDDGAGAVSGPSWLEEADNPWVVLLQDYARQGVVEPALHGFEHRRHTPAGHRPGEFCGAALAWQYQALRLGRDVLAKAVGRPVRVFVPPWNAWDANTARALIDLGFEWCSSDWQHATGPAGLGHLPQCSADPKEILQWMGAENEVPAGSILTLVTHPFTFEPPDGDAYFRALEDVLICAEASSDWKCVGVSDLPAESSVGRDRRFQSAVAWQHARDLLEDAWGPARLAAKSPVAYRPLQWYVDHQRLQQVTLVATLTIPALLAVALGRLVATRLLRRRRWILLGAAAASAGLAALIIGAAFIFARGFLIRGIRWQAICFTAGLVIALWVSARIPRSLPLPKGEVKTDPNKTRPINEPN